MCEEEESDDCTKERKREKRDTHKFSCLPACLPAVESQYCVVIIINMCYYPPIQVNNKAAKARRQASKQSQKPSSERECEEKIYFFIITEK